MKYSKIIKNIIIIMVILVTSCTEQDVCNYNGGQIVDKEQDAFGIYFRFRKDGTITQRIYVVEYDWNKYNVGDTLYCK
jgi:hypothetical protein